MPGLKFLRYADDIIVFCDSRDDAKNALQVIASIMDRQQRLILQHHKTRILDSDDLGELADKMIEDRPINEEEDKILYHRTCKETVHQLGHLHGMGPCRNPRCAMYASERMQDIDSKREKFCDNCLRSIGRTV